MNPLIIERARPVVITLLVFAVLALFTVAAFADTYNAATNQLTIDSITLDNTTYTDVVITVGSLVSVGGYGPADVVTCTGADTYDFDTGHLTIACITLDNTTYTDVVITVGSLVSVGGSYPSKPGNLPNFQSLSLYSAASPFNQKIGPNPEIDPDSALLAGSLSFSGDFVIQVKQYSAPVYFADENTPRHKVELQCGSAWELGVNAIEDVPIPDWAEPAHDADGNNPPVGCGEDSDQDNNMIILDPLTRCEYDFWQARKTSGQWTASWGNSIQMDSNGIYAKGISTRGSGFAFLGGVIWPDELQNMKINHALAFSYPFAKAGGPVTPATDSDGVSDRSDAIPEGARLQLNPALDLDKLNLTSYEKTIARALQEYGMILVDDGTAGIGLYAIDPKSVRENPYKDVLPDKDYPPLSNIPLNEFRVLKLSDQVSNWRENLGLVESGCGKFR